MAQDLESVRRWVADYGPLAVGVGSALDNTGVPVFLVVGLAAAQAVHVTPVAMAVAAVVGSIVGDLGTYAIGRYYLTKERITAGGFGKSIEPMLRQGERAMRKWGVWSIIFLRFVPYVGKIVPFLAGSYQMPWPSVVASVTVGSVLLVGFFYAFAESALLVVSGHGTTLRAASMAIGAATLGALYWANGSMRRRGQFELQRQSLGDPGGQGER